ncbi:MAG: PKD domain-containing protein [Planctomycetota bacterium]
METPASIAAGLRRAADFVERSNATADGDAIHKIVGSNGVVHVRPGAGLLGDRPLDADLLWDFGDPGGRRNQLPGFNAAHRYSEPGEYTVTLVLRHAGSVSIHRSTVRVPSVDRSRTITQPAPKLGDGVRLELTRGNVYDIDETIVLGGHDIRITAVGTGPPPILRWVGGSGEMIRCTPTCRDVLIEGIAFDAVGKRGDRFLIANAIAASGTNLAIIDCRFDQVQDAINANGRPTGLLIQRCTAGDDLHAYLCWAEGTDIVLLDNTATHSIKEHIVRVGGAERLLGVGNAFTNRRKSCFNVQVAEQVWLEDNRISGAWALGPLGGADGRDSTERCRIAVVRSNVSDTTFELKHGAESVRFSGNLLHTDNQPAICIEGFSAAFDRGVTDIDLYDNTAVNLGEHGNFLRIDGPAKNVRLTGNRYLAPRLRPGSHETAVIFILDDNADAIVGMTDNHWPDTRDRNHAFAGDGLHYVWPTWSDQRGYVRDLTNPSAGSAQTPPASA